MNRCWASVVVVLGLLMPMGTSVHSAEYRLDTGDAIRVTILDEPQLGATYAVADDGSIAMPGLDRIPVRGMTLTEATQAVRRKLDKTLIDPAIAIQIETYRPFYIMGDVARPGMYPAQPGLSLLEAVAVAGGYKGASDFFDAAVTGIRAVESRSVARQKLFQTRVLVARLEAELAGAEEFVVDFEAELAGNSAWGQEIVRREQESLKLSTAALSNELTLLERERNLRDREIAALEARIQTHAELAELLETEIKKLQALVERGVATVSRLNEERREQLRTRSDALQMTVLLNQARQAKTQLDLRLGNLPRDRRLQVLSNLREAKAEVDSLLERVQADEAVIIESDAVQHAGTGDRLKTVFTIRHEDGTEARASEGDNIAIRPGDVVIIDRTNAGAPTLGLSASGVSLAQKWLAPQQQSLSR